MQDDNLDWYRKTINKYAYNTGRLTGCLCSMVERMDRILDEIKRTGYGEDVGEFTITLCNTTNDHAKKLLAELDNPVKEDEQ